MSITQLAGDSPILAYFGGYAPADRRTYELFVLADGGPARVVSLQQGTIPGMPLHEAALQTAQGRPPRGAALRAEDVVEQDDLFVGRLYDALASFLAGALFACHRGLSLRRGGTVVASVRLFGFTLPELRGGVFQAPRLPDHIVIGEAPDHPQLWTPGVALTRLPRRYHRRAAQENHPLWSA
jgi:hypothetical protein